MVIVISHHCNHHNKCIPHAGGEFPFLISVAGQFGRHYVVLVATDSTDESSVEVTVEYDLGGE